MNFIDIIEDMKRQLGLTWDEMRLANSLVAAWRERPGTSPQPRVLHRIAEAAKIEWLIDPATGAINGWRRKIAGGQVREQSDPYIAIDEKRHTLGVLDIFAERYREIVDKVLRMNPNSSDKRDPAMDEKQSSLYEASYRILLRDLESISESATTKMRERVREFENDLDRYHIDSDILGQREAAS